MKANPRKIHCVTSVAFMAILLTSPAFAGAGQQDDPLAGVPSSSSLMGNNSRTVTYPSDKKPGPAWRTIGGTVKQMRDSVYTIEDYDGNHVHLFVSRETKQLGGRKKIGDHVRAEITHGGFANSIQ
jgi:hypothetical protein